MLNERDPDLEMDSTFLRRDHEFDQRNLTVTERSQCFNWNFDLTECNLLGVNLVVITGLVIDRETSISLSAASA